MVDESWLQNVTAKGSSYPNLVWYGREILNTTWAFILWSLEIGFYFVFYRTGHKNVLHRHGMIPCGAQFHYFLWFEMRTDHNNISSLCGLFLRELLNWLVLLVVNHTGYKNLFLFLSSYTWYRVSLESFPLTLKRSSEMGTVYTQKPCQHPHHMQE